MLYMKIVVVVVVVGCFDVLEGFDSTQGKMCVRFFFLCFFSLLFI